MKLFCRIQGEGKPLIILHGLFGQSDNWNTLSKRYAAEGFKVFTADMRNHGLSPHSETFDYPSMGDDILELINDHQMQRPSIIGHSMGGKAVMFFELMHSGIAEKIVVADIAPRAYQARHSEVLKALSSVDLNTITDRKQAEEVMLQNGLDFGTRQFLLKNLYRREDDVNRFAWRFNLSTIIREYDNISVEIPEGKSNVKAMFLRGGKSDYITKEDEADILRHFPNAEIKTVADSGHWIHAEKPSEFFEETLTFLKQ